MKADWSDEELLTALHLRDHQGMTTREIGERMGRPHNSVIGALKRVNSEADKHDADGIQNGTMKPLWWRRK
jgi:chromosomal replication initiation ATPase DnaA